MPSSCGQSDKPEQIVVFDIQFESVAYSLVQTDIKILDLAEFVDEGKYIVNSYRYSYQ